jgi:hypothetical protein
VVQETSVFWTLARLAEALARAILSNLPQLTEALEGGSIVTFERSRARRAPCGLDRSDALTDFVPEDIRIIWPLVYVRPSLSLSPA